MWPLAQSIQGCGEAARYYASRERHAPRFARRTVAADQSQRREMAKPAPLGAINAQKFAAPGPAIGAMAMAVERDAEDCSGDAVFGRDRRDMRDMVLYGHERQAGLFRIARR